MAFFFITAKRYNQEIVNINSSPSGEKIYTTKESSITQSHRFSYWTGIYSDSTEIIKVDIDSSFVVDSIPFANWNKNFASSDIWDIYPGELLGYNELLSFFPISSVSFEESEICGSKIDRVIDLDNCFAFEIDVKGRDSIGFDCKLTGGNNWEGYAKWTSGLGLTEVYYHPNEALTGIDYSYSDSLIAFRKNGNTCGVFTLIEEMVTPIDIIDTADSIHQYISPFINPAPETIDILPHPDLSSTTFSLIDLQGREVLSMEIQGEGPVIVNLPKSLSGLYIARFLGPSGEKLAWYKMMIE